MLSHPLKIGGVERMKLEIIKEPWRSLWRTGNLNLPLAGMGIDYKRITADQDK